MGSTTDTDNPSTRRCAILVVMALIAIQILCHGIRLASGQIEAEPAGEPPVVPSPTPTPTPSATATATPTNTPTTTPTATPTTQTECQFYRLRPAIQVGGEMRIISPEIVDKLSCLRTFIGPNLEDYTAGRKSFVDDAMPSRLLAIALAGHPDFASDTAAQQSLLAFARYGGASIPASLIPRDGRRVQILNQARYKEGVVYAGGVYLDRDCKAHYAPTLEPQNICGDFSVNYWLSPISLHFGNEGESTPSWKVVRFELIPGRHDWITWKASREWPLLVYTPGKSRTQPNGRTLFGSWSFGGKPNALRPVALRSSNSNSRNPWEHGYQPLSLLDENANGVLEGAELGALSLWFDNDQDAELDPGELRSAASSGVTKISVRPDQFFDSTQEWSASVGYERIVNGTIVTGKSIDWTTQVYASSRAAIEHAGADAAQGESSAESQHELASNSPARPIGLTGIWAWTLPDSKAPAGLLFLNERDGAIRGFSVIEEFMDPDRSGGARSILRYANLKGIVNSKDRSARFVLQTPLGQQTTSELTLDDAGALRGSSKLHLIGGAVGPAANLSYNWRAVRVGSFPDLPE